MGQTAQPGARTGRGRIVEELPGLILGGEQPRGARPRQDQLADPFPSEND